ncbi:MAG: hypothetical protein NVSMB30_13190 [Hymenobacter sp.]
MPANLPLPTDSAVLQELLLAERARRERAEAEVAHLLALSRVPELNPNPILRLNAAGELLFANAAASHLAQELQTTGPSRIRPQLVQAVSQALRTGAVLQRELMANGQYFLLSAVPMVEDGYALLYLTDVSAQRRAERDTRDQHDFYEAMLARLPAVVAALDADQHYLYINPHAADSPAERRARLGTTFADRCAAKGLPPALAVRRHWLFERAVRTREAVTWEEHWPTRAGGGPAIYWLCSYQPVFGADGALQVVMSYGFDITNLRQAEGRLIESEALMQAQQAFTQQVLDLNPNCIYVREPYRPGAKSRIVFENRANAELRERILSLSGTDTLTDAVRGEEIRTFIDTDAEVLRSGQALTTEDRLTLATGEVRWYQSVRSPLTVADGTVCILGVSTEITDLKAALHAAEAAATARENFLANMSHEIRTPLNGVLGMTSLLAKTGLNEQQRSYTTIIQHSGRHLLNVVNDVLDMAKITSGKLELEQTAFNLCDSMAHAGQPLVLQAQEKGITVVGTLLRESCAHPWVVGDPYRLNQVLLNLLSNAIKFTPAGGTITVGGYFVRETDDTLTTEFRVSDTGIGIAADKLESIFQEFTQAYADTTRQFGGTGLGLSISRALVAQMGGQLTVQSEPGQGSTFSFVTTLPKATPEARLAARAPSLPVQEASLRGRRVLLVEDNTVNREVAQLLLEGHGVVVDQAASGLEALAHFEQHRYDVVLMDIQMPGMNGLEATARIRTHADPTRAATPILALTANAFRADADKYLAAGMNDTLSKPFDEAELLGKLASLITGPAGPPPLPGVPPVGGPAGAPPYDLALLRQTARGSLVFMNRILASFHANTPASLAELRTAHAAADWATVAAVAHKLRPALRLLGAAGTAPWLEVLEAPAAPAAERNAAAGALTRGLENLLQALPTAITA